MTEVNVTDYLSERRGKNEAERQQSSTGFIISIAVAILSWILVVCVPAASRNIMLVIAIIPSIAAVVYSSDGSKLGNIEGIIRSGQEGENTLKASLHECLSDEYIVFLVSRLRVAGILIVSLLLRRRFTRSNQNIITGV